MKLLQVLLVVGIALGSCGPEKPSNINYPPTGAYGDNILLPTKMTYANKDNSLEAMLPSNNKVKIVITGKSVSAGPPLSGVWYVTIGSQSNWSIGAFDPGVFSQTFTSINGGLTSDLKIMFDKGTFQIDYYENDVTKPSASKTITVSY